MYKIRYLSTNGTKEVLICNEIYKVVHISQEYLKDKLTFSCARDGHNLELLQQFINGDLSNIFNEQETKSLLHELIHLAAWQYPEIKALKILLDHGKTDISNFSKRDIIYKHIEKTHKELMK